MRIGIDLGGTKIEGVVLADGGTIAARRRVASPSGDYAATVREIRDLALGLEEEAGGPCSVGIGTPGAISPATGLMKNANSTCLNGKRLDADLAQALGRPVRIANDADCFALSEATDGAAAGASVVFGVIIGTGCGGGVVVGGRPLRGPNAIAGEWGHNPLPWAEDAERPGPRCYCGKSGCIETFLSGPGLAADHPAGLDPASILRAAEAGDDVAEATLRRYERRLAKSLAHVINLLDPDVIVLGGGLSNLGRLYRAVPAIWDGYVFSDRVTTRLVPPRHGDSSGVRGAAWLWPREQAA